MLSKQEYKNYLLNQIKQKQEKKRFQKQQQSTPRNQKNINNNHILPKLHQNIESIPLQIHKIAKQISLQTNNSTVSNNLEKQIINKNQRTKTTEEPKYRQMQSQQNRDLIPIQEETNNNDNIARIRKVKSRHQLINENKEKDLQPRQNRILKKGRNLLYLQNINEEQLKLEKQKKQLQKQYLRQQIEQKFKKGFKKQKIQIQQPQSLILNKNNVKLPALEQQIQINKIKKQIPQIQKNKEQVNIPKLTQRNGENQKKQVYLEYQQVQKMINKAKQEIYSQNLMLFHQLEKAKLEAKQAKLQKQKIQFELYKIKEQLQRQNSINSIQQSKFKIKRSQPQDYRNYEYFPQTQSIKRLKPLKAENNQILQIKKYEINQKDSMYGTLKGQTKKIPLIINNSNTKFTMSNIDEFALDNQKNKQIIKQQENIQSHFLKNQFLDVENDSKKKKIKLIQSGKIELVLDNLNKKVLQQQHQTLEKDKKQKNVRRKWIKKQQDNQQKQQFDPYKRMTNRQRLKLISSAKQKSKNKMNSQQKLIQENIKTDQL